MQLEQEVQYLRSQPQPTYEPIGNFLQTCWLNHNYYAGFEFVFLKPHVKKSVAFSVTTPGQFNQVNDVLHEYNYDTSPRIFLGFNDCEGFGFRASYWTFDDSAGESRFTQSDYSQYATSPLGIQTLLGDTIVANQSLELDTLDLEVTQQFRLCQLYGLASAGARYGHYRRYTRVDFRDSGNIPVLTEWADDEFHGFGPTVNLELLRPINCSCWSLYSKARGSILFGESDSKMVTRYGINGSANGSTIVRADDDNVIAIFDIQMGVQYDWGIWTFRGGWEGQFWDDPGESIFAQGEYVAKDLGLTGFNLSIGCTY